MRSGHELCLAAAALAAAATGYGCGNYSNDDVAFIAAVPHGASLHVAVPALQAQPVCANGTADSFVKARSTGASINAGLDGVLALVDFVRGLEPTTRALDRRTWGPFPDDKHPGVEIEVIMVRRPGATPGQTRFLYAFEARRAGGPFIPLLEGTFLGASAETGSGVLEVHFDNARALAIGNPGDPQGLVDFFYDLASDPRTLSLQLNGDGFGLSAFAYQYAGYKDGHAIFDFIFSDANATRYFVDSKFAATVRGRADVQYRTSAGATGSFVECWDDSACTTYKTDPAGAKPPIGSLASCPVFP